MPGVVGSGALAFILCVPAFGIPLILGGAAVRMIANTVYDQVMFVENIPLRRRLLGGGPAGHAGDPAGAGGVRAPPPCVKAAACAAVGRAAERRPRRAAIAVGASRAAAMLLLLAPIALVIFLSFGADSYSTVPPTAIR